MTKAHTLLATSAAAQGPFASYDRASEPGLNDPRDLTIRPGDRLYRADADTKSIARSSVVVNGPAARLPVPPKPGKPVPMRERHIWT